MKDWQLGYELEELRSLAAPFKERYGSFVFGAFALPKERDLALALKEGRLLRLSDGALALARQLKVAAAHRDFTGRVIKAHAGDWMVSDFCPSADPDLSLTLLEAELRQRGGDALIWLEMFREDEPLLLALAARNFFSIATKIAASSEIKGLYLRCQPWQTRQRFARVPLPLDDEEYLTLNKVETAFLDAAELAQVDGELAAWEWERGTQRWAQHYSSYNKRGSWTAFCLRGFFPDPLQVMKPAEMSKAWKAEHPELLQAPVVWTEAAEAFKITRELLGLRIPGEFQRVRFMRLASGDGELTRHADITDRDAGVADGKIARLHLPIRSHPDVQFSAWAATGYRIDVNMRPGDLWYLDQRKPHTVKNASPVERVHLVIDVLSSAALRRMLGRL